MITLLHLSDIHFKKMPNEADEYSQMRTRMYEILRDICKTKQINGILICGDIAYSGLKKEYDEKAKPFIGELQQITRCDDAQIYMVSGNHDRTWNVKYGKTRSLMRNGFLHCDKSEALLSDICLEEPETLRTLLEPSANYIEFASRYSCISDGVRRVVAGQEMSSNDKMYWVSKLFEENGYTINLIGINTTLLSDSDDKNHKQFLPVHLYRIDKQQRVINISMMHHPVDEIKNGDKVAADLDKRFLVQLTGHIHVPSSKKGSVLKISSGAFMPPMNENKEPEDGYNPVFNIISFEVANDEFHVDVQPYKWEWSKEDKDDGVFVKQEVDTYYLQPNDGTVMAISTEKVLKLPEGLRERDVEIKWINHPYNETIIKKMYPDFYIKHDFLRDSTEFFGRLKADDRYQELYELLTK